MGKRTMIAIAAVAAALGWTTAAQAYEFNPSWGRAQIDDNPFVDPRTGQPLPPNQAFPRGRIRDEATDNRRARIRVLAFGPDGGLLSYFVDEYNAVLVPFDRRLDVGSNRISYLRYDFCRLVGTDASTQECLPSHRIFRPAAPAPPPPPPPASPPPPPPPVVQLPPGKSCVPSGTPLKMRLVIEKRRARARIIKVKFILKVTRAKVVDRSKPYRAKLPVALPPGTRGRAIARVFYRVPGLDGTFKRTVSKRFRTCP